MPKIIKCLDVVDNFVGNQRIALWKTPKSAKEIIEEIRKEWGPEDEEPEQPEAA